MTQQFKFGDRVYFPSNVEEIGIVIQVLNSENKIVVAWNDGEQTTEAIDDVQLTIIPHPDTARLNFIDDVCASVMFITQYDSPTKMNDYCRVTNEINQKHYQGRDVRKAIDKAMQQEQKP